MKRKYYYAIILLALIQLACISYLSAQYFPTKYLELKVYEKYGENITNFPALFIINTQLLIVTGDMDSTGADIRFSTGCPGNFLDYWIESGINTDSTRIWVRIPQLSANDSLYLRMFYGDTAAAASSSFTATFPNALNTTSSMMISGTKYYGWLKVNPGHTITIDPGIPLKIFAEYARIEGNISGLGMGYQQNILSSSGTGPGGGGTSPNNSAGSGGGGYGGSGGMGGYDSGDQPGQGGITYGSSSGNDIAMGSSGGSSDNDMGGDGGGAFSIYSDDITVVGNIIMDGGDGAMPGSGRGGGGGAGGGIMITAKKATINGTLSAKGGAGSVGTSTANDSGGGGGGGRIKIFYGSLVATGLPFNVAGGAGGPYGGAAPGANGMAGSNYTGAVTFKQNFVGNTYNYSNVSTASDSICSGDSIYLGGAYQIIAGTYTDTLINSFGCDSIVITTLSIITVDTSVSVTGTTLTANASAATYQWYNCNTGNSIPGAVNNTYTPSLTGNYAVIVTQNNCTDTSSCHYIDVSIGIGEQTAENIVIRPNPAKDNIYIAGLSVKDNYLITLMDISGRIISSFDSNRVSMTELQLRELPEGLYFIQIINLRSNNCHLKKIIRQ